MERIEFGQQSRERRSLHGACALLPNGVGVAVLLLPSLAAAHSESGIIGGFESGFLHPLTGLDHIVAMVAVGLWGAFLGQPAVWLLPVLFPIVMALGGAAGILGIPLPHVEIGIALSGIVLGLMVALAARPPLWVAAVLVGFFAVFVTVFFTLRPASCPGCLPDFAAPRGPDADDEPGERFVPSPPGAAPRGDAAGGALPASGFLANGLSARPAIAPRKSRTLSEETTSLYRFD